MVLILVLIVLFGTVKAKVNKSIPVHCTEQNTKGGLFQYRYMSKTTLSHFYKSKLNIVDCSVDVQCLKNVVIFTPRALRS